MNQTNNKNEQKKLPQFLMFIAYLVSGQIGFPKNRKGNSITYNGEFFTIFRHMVMKSRIGTSNTRSTLYISARYISGTIERNQKISAIPIPLITTQPGFVSKLWGMNNNGKILGLYQWETKKDAEAYLTSVPIEMLKKRIVPDSFIAKIK